MTLSLALFAFNANAQLQQIYYTNFANPADQTQAATTWTPGTTKLSDFSNTGWTGTPAHTNYFCSTSSTNAAQLNFTTPLALTPDTGGSGFNGKIIVHWAHKSANRVNNMTINGGTAIPYTTTTSQTENTISYDIPSSITSISTIKFASSGSQGLMLFDIEIQSYGVLGTDDFKADSSATVYANGGQVFVSNVKSNTTVSIYSVLGSLVKTVDTSSDTSFELAAGVWIAKVKSAEGEKSVKLLVK